MLEGLEAVNFSLLEDAYGPAAAVPDRLRALTGPREAAKEALWDLTAGIFHQGSFFSASGAATRFLVEIAAHEVPARVDLVALGGHVGRS
jgi:hypothetical protein